MNERIFEEVYREAGKAERTNSFDKLCRRVGIMHVGRSGYEYRYEDGVWKGSKDREGKTALRRFLMGLRLIYNSLRKDVEAAYEYYLDILKDSDAYDLYNENGSPIELLADRDELPKPDRLPKGEIWDKYDFGPWTR